MRKPSLQPARPRIRYVSPRFQGPAVLGFAVIIVAGGAIFWKLVDDKFQRVFPDAAIRAHYTFVSAYDIIRDLLAWHLAGLFVGIFLAGSVFALFLISAIRHGIGNAVGSLRASTGGDLSTPTGRGPIGEFGRFAQKVDVVRSGTLASVIEIRNEALALAAGGMAPEEFRLRWDVLKQRIRGIAP
ncbi:MAG: hypothetical protein ACM3OG_00495 [Actinomycetota bacterium]